MSSRTFGDCAGAAGSDVTARRSYNLNVMLNVTATAATTAATSGNSHRTCRCTKARRGNITLPALTASPAARTTRARGCSRVARSMTL